MLARNDVLKATSSDSVRSGDSCGARCNRAPCVHFLRHRSHDLHVDESFCRARADSEDPRGSHRTRRANDSAGGGTSSRNDGEWPLKVHGRRGPLPENSEEAGGVVHADQSSRARRRRRPLAGHSGCGNQDLGDVRSAWRSRSVCRWDPCPSHRLASAGSQLARGVCCIRRIHAGERSRRPFSCRDQEFAVTVESLALRVADLCF